MKWVIVCFAATQAVITLLYLRQHYLPASVTPVQVGSGAGFGMVLLQYLWIANLTVLLVSLLVYILRQRTRY